MAAAGKAGEARGKLAEARRGLLVLVVVPIGWQRDWLGSAFAVGSAESEAEEEAGVPSGVMMLEGGGQGEVELLLLIEDDCREADFDIMWLML